MVHYTKVSNGLMAYARDEIVSRFDGSLLGWGVAIASGIIASRTREIFEAVRSHPALKIAGVIDGEMIDIDLIYAEALKASQKTSATVNVPVIGAITFTTKDVESLYRYIIGG